MNSSCELLSVLQRGDPEEIAYYWGDWRYGERLDCELRTVVKAAPRFSSNAKRAFMAFWAHSKMSSLGTDNRALCDLVRLLTPAYKGGPLTLYRGGTELERQRRCFGLSWTSSRSTARDFARGSAFGGFPCSPSVDEKPVSRAVNRAVRGLVLKTVAPAEAIMCRMWYAKPLTAPELRRLRKNGSLPPGEVHILSDDRAHEREYLVDRSKLRRVEVVEVWSAGERA